MTLCDIVDLHVHPAPDVRPRTCDDLSLARELVRVGAKAAVIKSHHMMTADRALIASQAVPGATLFGGVVLNRAVGGLNPDAVEVALKLGGKVVWLPTLSARNHRSTEGKADGIPVLENGRVVPVLEGIFRQIAAAGAVLATGHCSPAEIRVVVRAAWEAGVRKVVVNHPEHAVVGMSLADQRALRRDYPVHFERCYAFPASPGRYQENFEINLRAICELGPECTVLATDVGQVENPPWAEAWEQMLEYYLKKGVREAELATMASSTPGKLLGILAP